MRRVREEVKGTSTSKCEKRKLGGKGRVRVEEKDGGEMKKQSDSEKRRRGEKRRGKGHPSTDRDGVCILPLCETTAWRYSRVPPA